MKMESKKPAFYLVICFAVCFCLFWTGEAFGETKSPGEPLEAFRLGTGNLGIVLGPPSNLRQDTADVAIENTTAYPGHFAKIKLLLKNHVPIAAFQFIISVSNPDVMDFHLDSVGVDTIVIPVDTSTAPGPHGDTRFADSLVLTPVGYCHIDTVGSLVSGFAVLECRCGAADTSDPCDVIEILGFAYPGNPIPSDSAYRLLFRLGVDVSCMSDSTTDRSVTYYMFPGINSFLSDPEGYTVPFWYHQGELTAWWSVPGDASNDSLAGVSDIVFLINYLFKNGPEPCIMEAADPSGDCVVGPADVVYLINYLFREGDPPLPGCAH
jgi:hypothetical protein